MMKIYAGSEMQFTTYSHDDFNGLISSYNKLADKCNDLVIEKSLLINDCERLNALNEALKLENNRLSNKKDDSFDKYDHLRDIVLLLQEKVARIELKMGA